MLFLRKALFYFLALAYCLLCPVIVLYSLGYLFKPGSGQGVMKSGLVHVSTLPAGASVEVNGKRFRGKTPVEVRNLLPGDYRLTLSLKGYRPWTRRVEVQPEKAVVFDKILLIPDPWPRRPLSADEYQDLVPIGDDRFFILTKGSLLEDLFVYDLKTRSVRPVVPETFPDGGARVLTRFLADNSAQFLLHTQLGLWGEEKFFWVDPALPDNGLMDVTHLLGEKPQAADWDPESPGRLFSVKDGFLKRLDVASGAVYPRLVEGVAAYGLSNKKVYVVNGGFLFRKVDAEGKNGAVAAETFRWMEAFAGGGELYKITPVDERTLLFLGRRGRLLMNRPPYRLVEQGVAGIAPDTTSKRVLVWRRDRLGVLDLSAGAGPRGGEEEHDRPAEIDWVVWKGRKIEQAFWVYGGSHVLFRDGAQLYLLEIDPPGGPGLQPCFRVRKGSSVVYTEASGRLYFLEERTGRFCAAEVVPKGGVSFLKKGPGGDGF